jgi:hypothetical protein
MPRVARLSEASLYPRAECLGDGVTEGSCIRTWPAGRATLDLVKSHIKGHPTHQVIMVRETRSIYGMLP